jgi:hypothetical protein
MAFPAGSGAQPRYAGYARKTDRDIPVIRLSRAG